MPRPSAESASERKTPNCLDQAMQAGVKRRCVCEAPTAFLLTVDCIHAQAGYAGVPEMILDPNI